MTPGQQKLAMWRADPVQFVRDNFHVEPDEWQKEVLEAFADPECRRIAEQACAGPGKTAVLAWCAWHFLVCRGEVGHHPNGAVMSVTAENLKNNLWKELSVWRSRSPFLSNTFEQTAERIFAKDHPETWFISARSWAKTADADQQGRTLSGLHAKYLLYLIDESGDISPAVLRSAEQGMTNCTWGKIMQAGNPTSHSGMLYESVVNQAQLWKVIRITGDPEDPKRSPRIDIEWAREQIALYGRDNPWVMAYILGQFPPQGINSLLSPEEIHIAMSRNLSEDEYIYSQKRLGIDAARFGGDPWVIFPRQGLNAANPIEMRNPRSQEVAARVMKAKADWGSEMEFFDATGGYAAGAVDCLIQAGVSPHEVQFSGKATDSRYFNLRSEIWFLMADWVKRGGSLPKMDILVKELSTPTYSFQNGKFRLEEKEQIKKRLGFSPNYADALATTFALPEMPTGEGLPAFVRNQLYGGNKAKSDFDINAEYEREFEKAS